MLQAARQQLLLSHMQALGWLSDLCSVSADDVLKRKVSTEGHPRLSKAMSVEWRLRLSPPC